MKKMISLITANVLAFSFCFPYSNLVKPENITVYAIYQNEVESHLSSLIATYNGKAVTSNELYLGIQCKGFANWVFKELFNVYIGRYPDDNVHLIENPNAEVIGILDVGKVNENSLKSLLQQAKPGDYIQAKAKRDQHSMIVVSVTDSGLNIFDNNSNGDDVIRYHFVSYSDLLKMYPAISLYHAHNYESNSNVNIESGMTISGPTVPPKNLSLGSKFELAGTISSNLPITNVWGGVYLMDGTAVSGASTSQTVNTYSYNLAGPFDYAIAFNNLKAGNYFYAVYAKDTSGKQYDFCYTEFTVGEIAQTPSKPTLTITAGSKSNSTIFKWNECSKATCYDLRIFDSDGKLVYALGLCDDAEKFDGKSMYTKTEYSRKLAPGSYYANVASVNSNSSVSPWWALSDDVKFTVSDSCTHKYDGEVTTTKATCDKDGLKTTKCSICGDLLKETIKATGHKYTETVVKPTCKEKGYTVFTCSVCKETHKDKYTDIVDHNYSLVSSEGVKTYKCDTCENTFKVTFDGEGTVENPYLITSDEDLRCMSNLVNTNMTTKMFRNKKYIQTCDIDMKDDLFDPIGNYRSDNLDAAFVGDYDGQQYKITNLKVNSEKYRGGLFSLLGGKVSNLSVYGDITGNDEVGGIAANMHGGTIINCSFNGKLSTTHKEGGVIGGIVGHLWRTGKVENCYVNIDVNDTTAEGTGGIAGLVNAGYEDAVQHITIKKCYVTGTINSNKVLGIAYSTFCANEGSTITFSDNYFNRSITEEASSGSIKNAGKPLSDELIKKVNELLDSPFAYNSKTGLNGGYPVFGWQLTNSEEVTNIAEEYEIGDVNNSKSIDITDLSIIALAIIGDRQLNSQEQKAADIDKDGVVGLTDLARFRQYLSKVVATL